MLRKGRAIRPHPSYQIARKNQEREREKKEAYRLLSTRPNGFIVHVDHL